MNPLNLPGPAFLAFYAVVFVAAVVGATLLRWFLRQPGGEPPWMLSLSPYEIAYLGGGEDGIVNAAIARLVHAEVMDVNSTTRTLTATGDEPPADASELERAVYASVKGDAGGTVTAVRAAAGSLVAPIRERLQDLGLVVANDQAGTARVLPLFLVLAVPLFSVAKIFVGIWRDKPVGFLVMFCIASVVAAFLGFGRSVHRSRRGDRALTRLKEENAAMKVQAGRRTDELSGDDLVLALGLFGMGILATGPLSRLQTALKPLASSSGWSSGCGGGGCGGGCGGGGCGGCGG